MEPLNVAVIGAGNMGKNHVRIYHDMDNVNLVAVCDTNGALVGNMARKYSIKSYTDYHEMIKNHNLDAVSIAVPTTYHKTVAIDIIKNKINVLIEKPIASDISGAEEIIKTAEENNVKLMVGHIERFNPAVAELKKRIVNGDLGKIYKFSASRSSPFPTQISDVGVVIDLAVHDLDVMRYLTNKNFSQVFSHTEQKIHSNHEDMLCALLKFEDGVISSLNIDWLTPIVIRELAVIGEKGMYKVNYLNQELCFYENKKETDNSDYSEVIMGLRAGNMTQIMINKKEPLKLELGSFINCIVNDSKPMVGGEDGIIALHVALKLIESAKSGEVMSL